MRHNCTVIVPNIANDIFIGYAIRSLTLYCSSPPPLSPSITLPIFRFPLRRFFFVVYCAIDLGIRYRQRPMRTYTASVAINICDRLCSAGTDRLCVFGYVIFHTIKLRWAFSRYAAREISFGFSGCKCLRCVCRVLDADCVHVCAYSIRPYAMASTKLCIARPLNVDGRHKTQTREERKKLINYNMQKSIISGKRFDYRTMMAMLFVWLDSLSLRRIICVCVCVDGFGSCYESLLYPIRI